MSSTLTTPLISLHGIDHVAIRVRDLEASTGFYCDVLGCGILARNEAAGIVHLKAGSQVIDLVWLEGRMGKLAGAAPRTDARNMHHFCLTCAPFDFKALSARLDALNIERSAQPQTNLGAEGNGTSLYVLDPDGNLVELKFYCSAANAL